MNWPHIFGKRLTWFSAKGNESQTNVGTSLSSEKSLSAATDHSIDLAEVKIPPMMDKQTEPKRYEDRIKFEGELTGRRLLRVYGLRTTGTKYTVECEADCIWLAFEGDTPHEHIWFSPQWRYCGPYTGFVMGVGQPLVLAVWNLPTFILDEILYAPPIWQALTGLYLCKIRSGSTYDHQIAAPLTLNFASDLKSTEAYSDVHTAMLSFDSSDWDERYFMDINGDTVLHHWALRSDVQLYLADILCADGVINPRRVMPPATWGDKEHLIALNVFYVSLQAFAIWWQTQTYRPITTKKRQGPALGMWRAVKELASFQIALHEGNRLQSNHGGWLDHDGEGYGEAWVRLTHEFEYEELAQSVREHAVNWMRYMAWDEWQSLLADGSAQLEDLTRTKWRQVCSHYMSWYQHFLENK